MQAQSTTKDLTARLSVLSTTVSAGNKALLNDAYLKTNGDWQATKAVLADAKVAPAEISKLDLAHSLAVVTGNNVNLVKALSALPGVTDMRSMALNFNTDQLAAVIKPAMVPAGTPGTTPDMQIKAYATSIMANVFKTETSAVLQRMTTNGELPITDANVKTGVIGFLNNQPTFNIRTDSVYTALQNPTALDGVADQNREAVVSQMKVLQRLQAISPSPETVSKLMSANLTGAYHVTEMTESSFVQAYSTTLGATLAQQVYTYSSSIRLRNEHALMNLKESVQGTGVAMIDKNMTFNDRLGSMYTIAAKNSVPLTWENLFGTVDFCECGDCNSVYSPAAYFVELLQYLRNNNLDPANPNTGLKGYTGTPLEILFRRRPDLGCLELTCANANTILPYIDLSNEVMESFVVHLGDYQAEPYDDLHKRSKLEAWNVLDETSGELLAQPQHTNYNAYCILKNAVYPFTLPYHQPVDAIRIFLNYLGTSRYELLNTFRESGIIDITADELPEGMALPPPAVPDPTGVELDALSSAALDRAADAEFLGLTQEEYIILTKEAFWQKRYFDLKCNKTYTDDEYRKNIGVKNTWEYYGYAAEADMLSTDEKKKLGLTFVKNQFLVRTGLLYTDLINLLETRFINPNYPSGWALTMLESIRFSYRYLQTLVDNSSTDPKIKFAKLIAFLKVAQPLIPVLEAMMNPDPCHPFNPELGCDDIAKWVYCYFDKVGKLIVLESGEGPTLPVTGILYTRQDYATLYNGGTGGSLGTLNADGTVTDKDGNVIGNVDMSGQVLTPDGKSFVEKYGAGGMILIYDPLKKSKVGFMTTTGLYDSEEQKVTWLPASDSCDITKVRLKHLDGTDVTTDEYDKMQRFIRLWNKLGWTMDELDKAISGLACTPIVTTGTTTTTTKPVSDAQCFSEFKDDCTCSDSTGNCGCNACNDALANCDITTDFIHQLVAVKRLLDSTGLDVITLLTFWTTVSIRGDHSLYSRLFLTANMLGVDTVFKADKNGNYLTTVQKITDHYPVLMAAFHFKAEDITNIMSLRSLPDQLTLKTISALYRHRLLMTILSVRSYELSPIISLFGDPFLSADATVAFLDLWGRMEDTGFNYRQLNYVINNSDDALKPLAPKLKTILQLAKTLYDGLNGIDKANPDLTVDSDATSALIRVKTSLIYEQAVVDQIMGLLEGTTLYSTNAPVNLVTNQADFISKLSDSLKTKLKYNFTSGGIQVTGILTTAEITAAKVLFADLNWGKAIDRVGQQALSFYHDVLYAIFPPPASGPDTAKDTLLQGDVIIAGNDSDPANTAPLKRLFFIKAFLPFLRDGLTHKFLVDTLSGLAGMDKDVTDVLISDVLLDPVTTKPVIQTFISIKNQPAPGTIGWKGYLCPSADDLYTFAITSDTQPDPIQLDGTALTLTQQDDPSNVWLSAPVKLSSGKLYTFAITGQPANLSTLSWKTPKSPKAAIPGNALLPDYSASTVQGSFIQLIKASIMVLGFSLKANEVSYLAAHASDFAHLDFNNFTLVHWERLDGFMRLRNYLPQQTNTDLISFLTWTSGTNDATLLSQKIADLTLWVKTDIDKLCAAGHFNLVKTTDFRNELNFLILKQALDVAGKLGTDINTLFNWARPTSRFWICHDIAESIRKTTKAKYKEEDWEQVVQPLNDQLRNHMRDALIAYLLVQPDLIGWGVVDADSLFEFFLIDVQMDSCMQTSRLKQAISSVQLFVQRCFLGLEEPYGVPNDVLDRKRWEWMQRDVLWEANRKVFLYPENWIDETLRDDKTSFYKELESELLQKDINPQAVQDALQSYLYKVDEVSNMQMVGLYIDTPGKAIHVFARTRNAPYFFYYREYKTDEKTWTSWDKIQVDIPSYDVTGSDNKVTSNGCYLCPVVFNNRLLIFFPQLVKKTQPNGTTGTIASIGNGKSVSDMKAVDYWEIKMSWSELRNGKWTQKQVSKDAIYSAQTTDTVDNYKFIPFIYSDYLLIGIDDSVDSDVYLLGAFQFEGSKIFKTTLSLPSLPSATNPSSLTFSFQRVNYSGAWNLRSWQVESGAWTDTDYLTTETETDVTENIDGTGVVFDDPYTHPLMGKLDTSDLTDFFGYNLTIPASEKDDAFGMGDDGVYNELRKPYSIYNWELFFHTPVTLADRLSKSQQFEDAMKWYHYVLNPMADGTDATRFWNFLPFKETDATNYLENYFTKLKPNTPDAPDGQINEWRNNPFQPHVIARSRPSAYMKWVVMKYLDNLIAWGDYLFTQHTIESINQATQLYILASHILGPKPQMIPKRGKLAPQTYNSLLDKWDAFGNAMVEMELLFPFSNQTSLPIGISNGTVGFANVFGFATTLYFCIPNNPRLLGYWDTVGDRLFKIRHCENIEGVFSLPPLWDAPIDPGLLVQATAQGLSLSSVLNDLNSPLPNYRFNYLLSKALELCGELKGMGNNLVSVFEKKDAEILAKMRARHDSVLNNLVMEVKKSALDEANKAMDGLEQNRKSPVYRLQHYIQLIGADLSKVPTEDTDYTELANMIETPVDSSGLKLIPYEKEEMDKASDAADQQKGIGVVETLGSILNIIPNFSGNIEPFGIGMSISFGGSNLGAAMQAVARGMQIGANYTSYQSSSAQRKGTYLRQYQDRVLQANIAGYEIKQIDKQILSQKIRIQMAGQDITNQQQMIDNASEVQDFLTSKYTNEDLYTWMRDSVKGLYYQVYTLAYDLAKKAEKVFRFERGLSTSNYIQFGYWDVSHDGLLAGENLYVGIKQLEAAYLDTRGHDFEVTKQISLRLINPLALLELRQNGKCEFEIPEVLFDMDFPGQYLRRIKSVALSVPCIAGPYTGVNTTLRLLQNKLRVSSIAKDKADYLEKTDQEDDRFLTMNIPLTAIATSNAQNDSGVFELNFSAERYMPFEGAGAISKWRLQLPSDFRQFNYDTITDVILHMRYTSLDGGDALKLPALDALAAYIKSVEELSQREGLFTLVDLQHDFPNEWYKATELPPGPNGRVLNLDTLLDRLPVFTRSHQPANVKAMDIIVFTTAALQASALLLSQNGNDNSFDADAKIGNYNAFSMSSMDMVFTKWQLKISDTTTALNNMWMVVRYVLK